MRWLVLLALAGCPSWSKGDYVRQAFFAAELAIDLQQTQVITSRCDEVNPVIGECGGNVGLTKYFISAFFVHSILAHVLVGEPRRVFQYLSIGSEGAIIVRNTQLGYK